jgi:hypothetical protein
MKLKMVRMIDPRLCGCITTCGALTSTFADHVCEAHSLSTTAKEVAQHPRGSSLQLKFVDVPVVESWSGMNKALEANFFVIAIKSTFC